MDLLHLKQFGFELVFPFVFLQPFSEGTAGREDDNSLEIPLKICVPACSREPFGTGMSSLLWSTCALENSGTFCRFAPKAYVFSSEATPAKGQDGEGRGMAQKKRKRERLGVAWFCQLGGFLGYFSGVWRVWGLGLFAQLG